MARCSAPEASIITLLYKVPMHFSCQNRIGIKLLTVVLNSSKEQIKVYAMQLENILNTQILGDEDDEPSQWSIPMSEDMKTVGVIILDNNRIHQIIEDFELIFIASVSDAAQHNKYLNCIPPYLDAMVIDRQQHDIPALT